MGDSLNDWGSSPPFCPHILIQNETEEDAVRNRLRASSVGTRNGSQFLIRYTKLDLRISLLSSEALLLHEETIPDRVQELKQSFLHDGVVKDPIIVDTDSCVVLDGMHRVVALRELRCLRMPVCAVDYLSPSITVGVWYRTLTGRVSSARLEDAFSSYGIRVQRLTIDVTMMQQDCSLAVLFASGECLRLGGDANVYETLRIAERCAREFGLAIAFETEQDALRKLMDSNADAIMTLPKIDKASIREGGTTGRLLPHKVTRHVIPARPLGVNVPLAVLTDKTTTLQHANEQFISHLQEREIARRPSGTIVDGRRYEEETFIFS